MVRQLFLTSATSINQSSQLWAERATLRERNRSMTAIVARTSRTVQTATNSGPRLWPIQGTASTQIVLVFISATDRRHVSYDFRRARVFVGWELKRGTERTFGVQCSTISHCKHALQRDEELFIGTNAFQIRCTTSCNDGAICWILNDRQRAESGCWENDEVDGQHIAV